MRAVVSGLKRTHVPLWSATRTPLRLALGSTTLVAAPVLGSIRYSSPAPLCGLTLVMTKPASVPNGIQASADTPSGRAPSDFARASGRVAATRQATTTSPTSFFIGPAPAPGNYQRYDRSHGREVPRFCRRSSDEERLNRPFLGTRLRQSSCACGARGGSLRPHHRSSPARDAAAMAQRLRMR